MSTDPRDNSSAFLRPALIVSWREIAGVLFVLLAPFALVSALGATHGSQSRYVQEFLSDRVLLLNGAAEASILGLGLIYLHWRGWTPADLRIRPSWSSSLQGVALGPLALIANGVVVFSVFIVLFLCQSRYHTFLQFVLANSPHMQNLSAKHLSWTVLLGAMVLNAFLEEIICTAYAFNEFAARRGPGFALGLTVLMRMACHTYQGFVHCLGIGAVFFVFGLWYWRTRNLWTLIFAHALIDSISLGSLKLLSH
jgi:membrane protease YdiL (CAAX protease family)